MFFDDAILASKELELTLTGRDCGQEERAPMCGVPYHAVDQYIDRLIEKGYKVAIASKWRTPATAKGIVKARHYPRCYRRHGYKFKNHRRKKQ